MSACRYQAVDAGGRNRRGKLQAESQRAARARLRGEGLIVLKQGTE